MVERNVPKQQIASAIQSGVHQNQVLAAAISVDGPARLMSGRVNRFQQEGPQLVLLGEVAGSTRWSPILRAGIEQTSTAGTLQRSGHGGNHDQESCAEAIQCSTHLRP